MKSAESLADNATRLLGLMRSSSQTAQVRRDALLTSFLLASPPPKTLRGGQAGGQHPRHHLFVSNLVADRDDGKSSNKAHADDTPGTPRHPCKLVDIAKAGPHGLNVLLLIPLKLRDGKGAFSNYRPPLTSILLASRPKETGPPSPGVDHGRWEETIQARRKLEARAGKAKELRKSQDPYL